MGLKDFFKNINSYNNKFPQIFHSSNWSKASFNEKLNAFRRLENLSAKNQNRLPRNIIPQKLSNNNEYGYFNPTDGNIYINSNFFEKKFSKFNYHAMNTVIHEGRHAYQDDIVRNKIPNKNNNPRKLWFKNKIAYYKPDTNHLYRFQPIERDSNNYSKKITEKFHEKLKSEFGKDKYFKQYNKDMNFQFQYLEKKALDAFGKDYIKEIDKAMDNKYIEIMKDRNILKDSKTSNRIPLEEKIKQLESKHTNKPIEKIKEINNSKSKINKLKQSKDEFKYIK